VETRAEMSSGLGASPFDFGTIEGDIVGETLCGIEWCFLGNRDLF